MVDKNEENNQTDQAKKNIEKADYPTKPHKINKNKKNLLIDKNSHLYVVDWQIPGKWNLPDT